MPATQSGSVCLPERDETSRTLLLLLVLAVVHASSIYADDLTEHSSTTA